MKKLSLAAGLLLLVLASVAVYAQKDVKAKPAEKAKASSAAKTVKKSVQDKVVVYYFHGNARCTTCKAMEAMTREAIDTGFKKETASGRLALKEVNVDEEANMHFVFDYKLSTKAVIVQRVVDGKNAGWTNLDQIWLLAGKKDKFIKYIQAGVAKELAEK